LIHRTETATYGKQTAVVLIENAKDKTYKIRLSRTRNNGGADETQSITMYFDEIDAIVLEEFFGETIRRGIGFYS